ncbi:MAG TPA: ubiquinone/menaquinone biosynthesis methyltransferase [Bdellovibrionota bacterium]|nr:ubiquinone/menaquinone biosynthesis methyltransferase [Bdellovibrionota bacterium]
MIENFRNIARQYDLLNTIISFGQHWRWKRRLVAKALELCGNPPTKPVLDISTGTGDVAARFVSVRNGHAFSVVGLDPCREMMAVGRAKYGGRFLWTEGFSEELPFRDRSVSIISCAFGVRNFGDLARAFREWKRVLVPGGIAAVLETHPTPPVWYRPAILLYWNHVMPRIGQLFSRKAAYEYLRDSTLHFLNPARMIDVARSAGLRHVHSESLMVRGMVSLTFFRNDD